MSHYRTPLRYPGGKQRLAPFIHEIIVENGMVGGHYVEPYAGGAGIALELLLNGIVSHIHLNDSSMPIYAFWKSVVTDPDELCRRIRCASLNVHEWKRHREIIRNPTEYDLLDVGFSTFYLNRCNRSGVLTGGLIGGMAQTGEWRMDARFSRNELIQRVELIASKKESITTYNLDAEEFMANYMDQFPENTLVYCDPPYIAQSSRLYLNHYKEQDHARVAQFIQGNLTRRWIVSYDCSEQVISYYAQRRYFSYQLQYSASRSYKGQEIFILSDDLLIPGESSLPQIAEAIKERFKEKIV